jgi:LysM repeat protein
MSVLKGIMLGVFLATSLAGFGKVSASAAESLTVLNDRKTHEVEERQTLFAIAREYGVSVQELRDWNALSSDALSPGMSLYVEPPLEETDAEEAETRTAPEPVQPQPEPAVIPEPEPETTAESEAQEPVRTGEAAVSDTARPVAEAIVPDTAEPAATRDVRAEEPARTDERPAPPAAASASGAAPRTHTVAQGETLFSIARRYGVTVQQIADWNQLQDNTLSIGQQLIIGFEDEQTERQSEREKPSAEQRADRADDSGRLRLERDGPAFTYYTVRRGDTLSGIARAHGISLAELREFNNLRGDIISIGQELIVGRETGGMAVTGLSVESTAQGRFYTHEMSSGERIERLLEKHQMDETDFLALNPGMTPSDVRAGQQIVLLAPPTVSHRNPYRVNSGKQRGQNGEETMGATMYASDARGQTTTSGDLYNPNQLTAAHPTIALGSVVHVRNPHNGKGIFVVVNDRTTDSRIRLSQKAFNLLGLSGSSPQVLVDTRLD